MVTAKDRRHDGWVYPNSTIRYHYHDSFADPELEPQPFWDDWKERRDGFRDIGDWKKIESPITQGLWNNEKRIRMNKKQKRLLKIRDAKKQGRSAIKLN
jgi:hypothetical protein